MALSGSLDKLYFSLREAAEKNGEAMKNALEVQSAIVQANKRKDELKIALEATQNREAAIKARRLQIDEAIQNMQMQVTNATLRKQESIEEAKRRCADAVRKARIDREKELEQVKIDHKKALQVLQEEQESEIRDSITRDTNAWALALICDGPPLLQQLIRRIHSIQNTAIFMGMKLVVIDVLQGILGNDTYGASGGISLVHDESVVKLKQTSHDQARAAIGGDDKVRASGNVDRAGDGAARDGERLAMSSGESYIHEPRRTSCGRLDHFKSVQVQKNVEETHKEPPSNDLDDVAPILSPRQMR
ncbi:uncharacterized protein BT62DRAFT_917610 [Guyanagaster necrorhizus]|uniref:Uncharacterized protein n=1 Tax=Guyanagaster necrorhizus TaxID=856835 RepID=A0A9P8AVZ5_9AGAR|nr:uncharacterized protein BT62DRAFT_917610 [Guyanagaster necrorhizus MCA 3950]KAG7450094.1 hypothetical protein BT62DRAFT_917610 [Guyanagaster necrorhizus MCA 3950]